MHTEKEETKQRTFRFWKSEKEVTDISVMHCLSIAARW